MRYAMRLGAFASMLIGAFSITAQTQEPQPITIEGKCAQQAGAPYDPIRRGWYTEGQAQAIAYRLCLHRKTALA
jgi:hypothetical protein